MRALSSTFRLPGRRATALCVMWVTIVAGARSSCGQEHSLFGFQSRSEAEHIEDSQAEAEWLPANCEDGVTTPGFLRWREGLQETDESCAGTTTWPMLRDVFAMYRSDLTLAGLPPLSESDPVRSVELLLTYDSYRGVPDGAWANYGVVTGANYGTRLGRISDWTGIGFQAGATVGVFNWAGSDYRRQHQNRAQVQGFFTFGLFRHAAEDTRWSAAAVNDWMTASTYSVFGEHPTMSQLRMQIGYTTSASNEVGVWGAVRVLDDTESVPGFGPVTWRPVNVINVYWHRKWSAGGADTWIWVGMPENERLSGGGSLGDYTANALANVPLNDRVALYIAVNYMHQSASPGASGSKEDAWNLTAGIALYPKANARSKTVAGRQWSPLLPIANNGTFFVDASRNY